MTQIFAITDWQFWLQAIKFGFGTWLIWYLPGRFLIRKLANLPEFAPVIALRYVVGLVLWTLLSYVFNWLNLRILTSVICFWLAWFEIRRYKLNLDWPQFKNWPLVAALTLGLLIQMPAVLTSGWKTDRGLELYFTNAEDGMMHASFIQNLISQMPPMRPEAAGLKLTNYHYLSDLATAEIVRVFNLPILATFYHFLPPLISILSGWLVFSLILSWSKRKSAGFLGLFFWYLGGDLGYLISLGLHQEWRWFAAAIDNGADQFLNPPQTFAKLIFLAGIYLLNHYWTSKSKSGWWLSVMLFASLIGFKIYFGLFAIMALGFSVLYRTLTKQVKLIEWLGLAAVVLVGLGLILPTYQPGAGLKYLPLAWPKLLFKPEHLDWAWWGIQAKSIQLRNNWWQISLINSLGIVVALAAILGTRLVGIFGLITKNKTWAWFWIPSIICFMALGLNTVQDPGGLNTFNFLIVISVPLICFSAITLDNWLQLKNPWLTLLVVVILILTPARSLRNAGNFLAAQAKHDSAGRMSLAEIEICNWLNLNTQPADIIQSHLDNSKTSQGTYLSFFSNRATFLTGRNILSTHGLTLPDRVEVLEQAADAPNYTSLQAIFKSSQIKYYFVENQPGQKDFMDKTDVADHTVFSNSAGWVIKL